MKKSMEITTWNVNGIRASAKNGMLEWLSYSQPEIFCMQEIKANFEDLDPLLQSPFGYKTFWNSAEKKGYSGVATYSKIEPLNVTTGLGIKKIDVEGRVQTLKFKDFSLVNAYFPNSQRDHARLDYKLEFCDAMKSHCDKIVKSGQHLVLCGDYNIAHKEIDLANPKTNMNNAGFLPEERAWMDSFLKKTYVDIFRHFDDSPKQYTWWSYRPGVREKNIGWRIDYHVVNEAFVPKIKKCFIQPDIKGSDHCPVTLQIQI